jgi:hypothetical protein
MQRIILNVTSPVLQGRRRLTYTTLDEATTIADVQEKKFRSNPEEHNFENFYRQVTVCVQLQPVYPSTFNTQTQMLRIIKNIPKRKYPGHDNIIVAFHFHFFPKTW